MRTRKNISSKSKNTIKKDVESGKTIQSKESTEKFKKEMKAKYNDKKAELEKLAANNFKPTSKNVVILRGALYFLI